MSRVGHGRGQPGVWALIPARGGSKRLPRKNLMSFAGKPMLAWTVEAAFESRLFEHVVVSTDDDEIAAVALEFGAEVLDRPASVSDDTAPLIEVIHHALEVWRTHALKLCLLLANCPLRTSASIVSSFEQFLKGSPSALLSVVSYGWLPPFRALHQTERGLVAAFPDHLVSKSQTYPNVLCPSGAIYWSTGEVLAAASDLYVDGITGFELPWHEGIDIDTRADFELAACLRCGLDAGFSFSGVGS